MGTRVRVGLVGQATGFGLIRVDLSADEMQMAGGGAARPGHRVSDPRRRKILGGEEKFWDEEVEDGSY